MTGGKGNVKAEDLFHGQQISMDQYEACFSWSLIDIARQDN